MFGKESQANRGVKFCQLNKEKRVPTSSVIMDYLRIVYYRRWSALMKNNMLLFNGKVCHKKIWKYAIDESFLFSLYPDEGHGIAR